MESVTVITIEKESEDHVTFFEISISVYEQNIVLFGIHLPSRLSRTTTQNAHVQCAAKIPRTA